MIKVAGTLVALLMAWPVLGAAWAAPSVCIGVQIRPADATKINAIIDSQAAGTTFCFEPGTYAVTSPIQTKSGDKLICKTARHCIVEGANATAHGFETTYQATADQLISGFVVRNFTESGVHLRPRGRAENNEVHDCEVGVVVNGTIVGNTIHHNRRYGVVGGPAHDILIEGNEIAFNNTARYDPLDDAGGTKIVGAKTGATVVWRGNKVHDNYGNGIWEDGNVTHSVYENNQVYANTGTGILHEISWTAVIRDNVVSNNNLSQRRGDRGCWYGAQIALNNSQDVEIYRNIVTAEFTNGICLLNTNRSDEPQNPTALANVKVHDNTIRMRGPGKSGFVGDTPPSGISFYANTYFLDDASGTFWEGADAKTRSQWQASGQDTDSVFRPW